MIGGNIRRLRRENNLTQEKLAGLVGTTMHNVGNWERGNGTPNPEMLVRLKRALNCTYEELLEGE